MSEPAATSAIGFGVGVLVGMTGVGGGALMLPVLVFFMHIPPIIAVGSDMVCNSVMKVTAGYLHWRHGTVSWRVVGNLGLGSVPGVIAGVAVLARLRATYGYGVNDILKTMMGVLLLAIPILLYVQGKITSGPATSAPPNSSWFGLAGIGALAGFLVGMTSVGAGSVIMLLLLAFFPFAPRSMVGSDIVHAVLLTGVASLLHLHIGTVDLRLAGALMAGGIPGAILGSLLSRRVPVLWMRRVLCAALMITGAKMLA